VPQFSGGSEFSHSLGRNSPLASCLEADVADVFTAWRAAVRGPNGARDEFLLAATAQNLRKLAKLVAVPAPAFAS
jgi:hypothetical protein